MNAEGIQNLNKQGYDSRDEESQFGKVKQVNAAMLDSESVISPPVAKETQKSPPIEQNFPNSDNPEQNSGRPFILKWMLLCAAGIVILLCASFLTALFLNRQEEPTISQQSAPDTSDFPSEAQKSSESQPVLETSENTEIEISSDSKDITNPAPVSIKNTSAVQSGNNTQNSTFEKPQNSELDENTQAELNSSLANWISATNERNVEQQMTYYAPKVNSFYRARNTSSKAVRDEKKRVFDGVDAVDIQTGKPNIVLSADGRTATMRFRKKYSIKKGQQNQNGEVIQELKWAKSKNGWRIISERDLKVIN